MVSDLGLGDAGLSPTVEPASSLDGFATSIPIASLEGPARAIAAVKRGTKPDHPEIDRIWTTYVGQARACIAAFLDDCAVEQKKRRK